MIVFKDLLAKACERPTTPVVKLYWTNGSGIFRQEADAHQSPTRSAASSQCLCGPGLTGAGVFEPAVFARRTASYQGPDMNILERYWLIRRQPSRRCRLVWIRRAKTSMPNRYLTPGILAGVAIKISFSGVEDGAVFSYGVHCFRVMRQLFS